MEPGRCAMRYCRGFFFQTRVAEADAVAVAVADADTADAVADTGEL